MFQVIGVILERKGSYWWAVIDLEELAKLAKQYKDADGRKFTESKKVVL